MSEKRFVIKNPGRLVEWFEQAARPLLAQYAADKLPLLDDDCQRLKRLYEKPKEITVCMIGNSAMGKSTLLNAVVTGEYQLLPSGGIGPLTALATTLKHGERKRFTVKYHKKSFLQGITTSLESKLRREASLKRKAQGEAPAELTEAERRELEDLIIPDRTARNEQGTTRFEEYEKLASQLITGRQVKRDDVNLAYLVDGLILARGEAARWGTTSVVEDAIRIKRLYERFSLAEEGKAYVCEESADLATFMQDLHDHAAGFLAPIVDEITFEWPSDLLKDHVVLVDLPGVGIANDRYRPLTQEYVRGKADAIVLVTNKSGLTESCIDLLRSSGYWDRLVGSADNLAEDACSLLVAVTHVDSVAEEEWARLRSTVPKDKLPRKGEIYAKFAEETVGVIRSQARAQLSKLSESGNEDVRQAETAAAEYITSRLSVHPVCAPEYRRLLTDDDDDKPFLKTADATGVPQFQNQIRNLADSHRQRIRDEIVSVAQRLSAQVIGELEVLRESYFNTGRERGAVDRLRDELTFFLAPLREKFANDQGSFRGYLSETSKERIDRLVVEAGSEAREEAHKYLRRMREFHWATLRAAVTKGGVWIRGRSYPIDLPEDIAVMFQTPMAGVWSVKLLGPLRERTHQYASDICGHVSTLHSWAVENGGHSVSRKRLNNHHEQIMNQAEQLRAVGKEAVSDLRDSVRKDLSKKIKDPIAEACQQFVARGDAIGPGVKQRILNLFEELAGDATKRAEQPAKRILGGRFGLVEKEIVDAFASWGDPLEDAKNIILDKASRVVQVEAKEAEAVVKRIDEVLLAGETRAAAEVPNEERSLA